MINPLSANPAYIPNLGRRETELAICQDIFISSGAIEHEGLASLLGSAIRFHDKNGMTGEQHTDCNGKMLGLAWISRALHRKSLVFKYLFKYLIFFS